MNKHHYVAIMAGGIGSRFWPMSRTSLSQTVPGYSGYRQNTDTANL